LIPPLGEWFMPWQPVAKVERGVHAYEIYPPIPGQGDPGLLKESAPPINRD